MRHTTVNAFASILVITSCNLFAQSGWLPINTGLIHTLHDVESVLPNQMLYAVGDSGTILRSDNRGISWTLVPTPFQSNLNAVSFSDDTVGYVVGDSGAIWKFTIDVTGQYHFTDLSLNVSDSAIGKSFHVIFMFFGFPFGYIIGDGGTILKTFDGGEHWSLPRHPVPTKQHLNAIASPNIATLYAVGDSSTILRSEAADEWLIRTPPPSHLGADYYWVGFNSDTGWIAGENGSIAISTNAGKLWTVQQSNTHATLRGGFLSAESWFSSRMVWMVGDSGVILRTRNQGQTWERQVSGTSVNLYSVVFWDSLNGIAVGGGGTILRTTTGGSYKPLPRFAPQQLSFGPVSVGSSKTGLLSICNDGVSPLVISSVAVNDPKFVVFPESLTVQPFGSSALNVTFAPTSRDSVSATITLYDNGDGSPHMIPIDGEGIDSLVPSSWYWESPSPCGNLLFDAMSLGNNTVIAVGDAGTIARTTNAGDTWKMEHSVGGIPNNLYAISFPDPMHGIAVGEYGTVVRTSDAGQSWQREPRGVTDDLIAVSFSDPNRGYAIGGRLYSLSLNPSIARTTNGGSSWISKYFDLKTMLYDIVSIDSIRAIAVGATFAHPSCCYDLIGIILLTTDGGENWVPVPGISSNALYSVAFSTDHVGFAVGASGQILKTTDAGSSWSSVYSSTSELLTDISFTDASLGMIIGTRGAVMTTSSGGSYWSYHSAAGLNNLIAGVHLSTGRQIVFGTDNNRCGTLFDDVPVLSQAHGTMSISTDGGSSWLMKTRSVESHTLTSVSFSTAFDGFAVGDSGSVLHTTDGGQSWSECLHGTLYQSAGVRFNGVFTSDGSTAYIIGGGGTILHTTDDGLNWMLQTSGTVVPLNAITFLSTNLGYAVGNSSTILKTTDGGGRWMLLLGHLPGKLNAVSFTNSNDGIVVGDDGIVYRTTDGGYDWTNLSVGSYADLLGVSLLGDTGYVVGGEGVILKTIDAGQSWTQMESGTLRDLRAVSFSDALTGMVVGNGGVILFTNDGGLNWRTQSSGTRFNLNGLSVVADNVVTAVGDLGTILRTESLGVVSVDERDKETAVPTSFALEQNYPNPFNPTTVIGYSIPAVERSGASLNDVTLKVFDVLGREVATLVDGLKQPGEYTVRWDASDHPGGVYFYRLVAGEFIETKKMLLIR